MAHRYTVTYGYCVELERHAACLSNGLFDNLCHLVQMNVAGNYLAETVGDADEGFVDVSVANTAGVQQCPVRSPLETAFYCVASHICLPFFLNRRLTSSGANVLF
jgi:hypothetical protein